MADAAKQQRSSKKRRVSDPTQPSQPPPKKKSPLYNQPQNRYAPLAVSSMSRDELSQWRKDQRRRRNRESAASSRIKNNLRVEKLEGERDCYKLRCEQLEVQMKEMQHQIARLEQMAAANGGPAVTFEELTSDSQQYSAVADNSPAVEPSVVPSSNIPDLFPALLSTASNTSSVETQDSVVKEHVTISRPAYVMY